MHLNKKIITNLEILLGLFLTAFGLFFLIFPSVNHIDIKDKNITGACIISDSTNGITFILNKCLHLETQLSLIIIFIILSWLCLFIASFFLKTKIIKKSFLATLILSLFLIFFYWFFSHYQQQVFNTFTVAKEYREFLKYRDYSFLKGFYYSRRFSNYIYLFQTFFFGMVFFGFSTYLLMVRHQIYLGINILIKALVNKFQNNHKALLFWLIVGFDIIVLLISFFAFKIIDVFGDVFTYDNHFLSLIRYILANCSVCYLIGKNCLITKKYDKESKNTKSYKKIWRFILFGIILQALFLYIFLYTKISYFF